VHDWLDMSLYFCPLVPFLSFLSFLTFLSPICRQPVIYCIAPVPDLILVVPNCSVLFNILYNTHMRVTFRYFGIEYVLVMSIVLPYYALRSFALTCVALYLYVLVQLYV